MTKPDNVDNASHEKVLPDSGTIAKTPEKGSSSVQQTVMVVGDGVLGAGLAIMLGVWGGNMLDDRFHTAPWISLTLSLLGGGLGLARLVSKANQLDVSRTDLSQSKPKSDRCKRQK
jgi:F0F1-type ATP synthase assembly protein I